MATLTDFARGDPFREGSMALLQQARAPDGTAVLIKRPRLGFGSHPACFAGFEVERTIHARLAGPHVPRFVAEGETGDGSWIALERIDGPSLADVAAQAPRPAAEVARLGGALATALHALHRQDVVHHDLKPSHVLFRPDGTAVLIDFGLACHGQLPDLVEGTDDRPLGTPAYLSPEQLDGRRGDPRSDLFSLGVILYQLATGRLPFGAPDSVFGMRRRLYLDPPAPCRLNPDLPDWLQEVILRCLAVRPENRYATAAQVAHDLAHPEQVCITERGRRRAGTPWRTLLRRAWQAGFAPPPPPTTPARQLAEAPHILVAIDTAPEHAALAVALCETARRLLCAEGKWRVTCLSVMESTLATDSEESPELARATHTERLIALKHWSRPLDLPPERLRYLVLRAGDAASGILDYARRHHVDHVVIGARGSSQLRRLLGSVSARVAAEAPCCVTVVRASHAPH
jgi:nucleotide-binding universal stress UspA family protein